MSLCVYQLGALDSTGLVGQMNDRIGSDWMEPVDWIRFKSSTLCATISFYVIGKGFMIQYCSDGIGLFNFIVYICYVRLAGVSGDS